MAKAEDYTRRITSQHADKPKYMSMVEAVIRPITEVIAVTNQISPSFDLDTAIGAQLDADGVWIGVSRNIDTPLADVYFSFDIPGLGFDQGTWKGPLDPDSGVSVLDNESYRALLRARIKANHWDGTTESLKDIYDSIFTGDTRVFVEDNQDMSMTIGVSGKTPTAVELALLTGGYLPIKPQGVRIKYYIVAPDEEVIFGFDADNEYIGGFDNGSWGTVYR
ncbi:DUF2612 domain-containing protein [Pseudomonas sp. NPDC098747]|uniref:DUF2612 domain-containing protein n=1 Tax=Pseudomonas sp. NPDC098747 TaxID=3364487 RepID=UPI00383B0947